MTFEKRWAMPDRISLVSTYWLTSWLAMLALVLFAPIRTSGFANGSSRTVCLRRNSALAPGQPTTHHDAALASDAILRVNALHSVDKQKDWADALDEPQVSFLIPRSLRRVADRQLIVPRSILSLYPLRC